MSGRHSTPRTTPTVERGRLALGAVELLAARRVARLAGAGDHRAGVATTARVLGARHVAQALATERLTRTGRLTSAQAHGVGAAVDGLHALSMLGLAAVASGVRRPALCSAAVAGTLAALEWRYAARAAH
ncbi:MAG TPA: hypothetical protein VFG88_04210 [Nocardioidaceae bacterium]|jgi:hypothetical protein|nr:hypothetical protein [Nocardioidaceae bacterium]